MRSQNCIRLLTIMSFVWHLCYKIEVAADIFVQASNAALSSPIGIGFTWPLSVSPNQASTAGDINGDTYPDLLLPASTQNKVYILFGTPNGIPQVDVTTMTPTQGITISGSSVTTFGSSTAYVGDVDGDNIDDILIGGTSTTAYVIFGKSDGTLMDVAVSSMSSNQGITLTGPTSLGGVVASAGDVNGDGINDMLVSATTANNPSGVASGVAYVIFGNKDGLSSMNVASLTTDQGFKVYGSAASQTFGSALSAAGDVNNDGVADFMVGAAAATAGGISSAGFVGIFYGRKTGISDIDASTMGASLGYLINGYTAQGAIGQKSTIASAGDVNSDGIGDMIIGQPAYSVGGSSQGKVYIIYGQDGTSTSSFAVNSISSDQGFTITGDAAGSAAGYGIASGDINNDGLKDLVVSAYGASIPSAVGSGASAGRVYVFFSDGESFSNIDLSQSETNYPQTLEYYGLAGKKFGYSVTTGDINGDGVDDIIGTSQSNTDTILLYGSTCSTGAQCSSSLHPVCYASLGCKCGETAKLLQSHKCVDQCSDGYYTSNTNCKSCPSTCATCTDATTCVTCSGTNLLQETSCVASCSPGYYKSGTNCMTCPSTCATCTGANTCQTCKGANLLQDTSCVATCDPGYYKSGTSCIGCPNTCATCTSSTTCQTCKGANLLQDTSCVASCDPGYTPSGTYCCPSTCATCTAGNICQICSGANLLQGTSCVASCDPGYTQSGTNCIVNSNTGGGNTGGTTSGTETITADSSSNHAGLIVGVVVGGVALITGVTTAFYYRRKIIAKFRRGRTAAKYASSTPNKPTAQITEGARLNSANGGELTPLSPQNPSGPASPNSQSSRSLPQTTQTHQVLKVEADP